MFDKKKKSAYIWYSGATDITGIKLAEALEIRHGKNKPVFSAFDLIIGWGTKIDETISLDKIQTLNHPNQILGNRNKFKALEIMSAAKVNVAPFIEASKISAAIKNNPSSTSELYQYTTNVKNNQKSIKLPLIGRTKYHQGGKGFWNCPTLTHVNAAINDGANYFQNMIEIKDEYRLHVFNNDIIYAVKKTKRSKEEYQEAYVRHELEHQKKLAEKNKNLFDEATAKLILERIAKKKVADGADMIIRSNRRGWKFSHITTVDKDLQNEAIKALNALKLNFGAVDCCLDINNRPYIIEINTGPGLEETPFIAYVNAFKDTINKINAFKNVINKNKPAVKAKTVPAKEDIAASAKDKLLAKAVLMTELVEKANESEAKALKGIFKKMFD